MELLIAGIRTLSTNSLVYIVPALILSISNKLIVGGNNENPLQTSCRNAPHFALMGTVTKGAATTSKGNNCSC